MDTKQKKKLLIKDLFDLKGKRQLAVTIAYDVFTAKACEAAGIDMLATSGEFLKQYVEGETVNKDDNLQYLELALKGVRRGAPNTFLYVGLPWGHPVISEAEAIRNAVQAMRWGADAIYFSGMSLDTVRALTKEKIPVVGHVGFVPWHAYWTGGFRAHGKTAKEAYEIYEEALRQEDAGMIASEIEVVPYKVAEMISKRVKMPLISMGSGSGCDANYLFSTDMFGMHDYHYPRHTIKYRDYYNDKIEVLKQYVSDIQTDEISKKQKLIEIDEKEFETFTGMMDKQ